ncbi:MAG: alpha/beta hydrolase [Balneolales bacterium]
MIIKKPLYSIALLISVLLLVDTSFLLAQDVQPLWPEKVPHAVGDNDEHKPELTVFYPEKEIATKTAVVIFPGGGYGHLAIEKEGYKVAKRFNQMGITAFVVKYRYGENYNHPVPLLDAQRAIRNVRHKAGEYGIDPQKIGILGFSAGGHLASTAGTHFTDGNPDSDDEIDRVSSRPDFMVLIYPVISMVEDFTHTGSRFNLLGENPDQALLISLSNERQVTQQTPPTILIHGTNDSAVPVENSLNFYTALKQAGVPAEIHIYEDGPHGFGLAEDNNLLSSWPDLCESWLKHRHFLD